MTKLAARILRGIKQQTRSNTCTMQYLRFPSYFIVILMLAGCLNAPRDNALDPSSPFFKNSASISGQVIVRDQNIPVPSATVSCAEQGISVQTNANGTYSFPVLSSGSLTVVCTRDGFTPDTQRVQLNPGSSLSVSFSLNGLPVVLSQNILTHKYDQYYPSPQYFVDISASVTDPNGIADLDSVWFAVDSLFYPMGYSVSTKLFQVTLYKYDFPTNTIEWLVGKSLAIRARDLHGAVSFGQPFAVTRVIENTAIPAYPTSLNHDTTGSLPLLKWSPPGVSFNYTYTLDLSLVSAGTETPVWSHSNISSVVLQFQFPGDLSGQTLASGNYAWAVSVVDEFGNSARSKEAAFVVR
jgi:hypothetical protein